MQMPRAKKIARQHDKFFVDRGLVQRDYSEKIFYTICLVRGSPMSGIDQKRANQRQVIRDSRARRSSNFLPTRVLIRFCAGNFPRASTGEELLCAHYGRIQQSRRRVRIKDRVSFSEDR
jgi:hypothetical protein